MTKHWIIQAGVEALKTLAIIVTATAVLGFIIELF